MIELTRTDTGKPQIHGPGTDGAAVSVTHDNRYCVAVAGMGGQGIDLEVVADRSDAEWKALLGPSTAALFEELCRTELMGRAGTRIWSAGECVFKALGIRSIPVSIIQRQGDAVLLGARTDAGADCQVLTLPVTLTLGRERMLAVVVESDDALEHQPEPTAPAGLTAAGFDPRAYTLTADETSGALIVRWPVAMRESANLDRSVYFTHYLEWMGKVREMAMQPIAEPFGAQLATGRWGMVTNHSRITILGEPRLGDVIETRYWTHRAPDQPRSTIDLHFEWRRLGRNGEVERAALGEMRVTWVAVIGHGRVRAEPFPEYFQRFIDARTPPDLARLAPHPLPEPLGVLDRGELHFRRPDGPLRGPGLGCQVFQTSLQDANAVGNIYFSNYYIWQGRLIDGYVERVVPDAYRGMASRGEARCVQARVSHLADAMPFDDVEVVMSLAALHERGVTFGFDYFRVEPDGSKHKVAFGEQEVVWVTGPSDARSATRLPTALVDDLQRAIAGGSLVPKAAPRTSTPALALKDQERRDYDAVASYYDRDTTPLTDVFGKLALKHLDLLPEQRILEVSCGSGTLLGELARRVGPRGAVTGVDLSEAMLELARARTVALNVTNVELIHGDAEELEGVPAASYDRALSVFGLMYAPHPLTALRRLRAVLKPGGRAVICVWGTPRVVPGLTLPMEAAACVQAAAPMRWFLGSGPGQRLLHKRLLGVKPGGGKSPMCLSPRGVLEKLLTQAGFSVLRRDEPSRVFIYDDFEDYWRVLMGTPARMIADRFSSEDRDQADAVLAHVRHLLDKRHRLDDGRLGLPMGAVIVVAQA